MSRESRPPGRRPLRIAMVGQKGLPATFGGIERHVEEIGARLAGLGHEVTVYCRPTYGGERRSSYRGMTLRELPALGTKHLDAITHSAVSTVVAMAARHDVVHYHALGPGLMAPLPRYLSGRKVVLTVHGLDHERGKWGRAAQAVLGSAHWMSARVPDRTIVVSRALADHYAARFGRETRYIPNGVDAGVPRPPGALLERLSLRPGGYALYVGRLVPEKAPDVLLRAFRRVTGDVRLVIAGDSSFSDEYVEGLRRLAAEDQRVVLPGYCYGGDLAELYSNAATFVLPSLLEGLPLTLLEAASYGVPIIATDIPPSVEVLGGDGPGHRIVAAGDDRALSTALAYGFRMAADERAGAAQVRDQVLAGYRWDVVARQVESLYLELVAPERSAQRVPRQRSARSRSTSGRQS